MKKIQLLTSIILTLLMIIAPQSIALAADDSSQASAVSLISDGFSVDKKAIYAGAVSYTHLTLPTICSV